VQVESTGEASRRSLRIDAQIGRPMARFNLLAFYTLSKSVDEADGPLSLPVDSLDLAAERGPSADDVRHRAFALASLRPRRGVQLTAMLRAQSSPPFEITTGRDDNADTVANDRPAGMTRNQGRGRGTLDLALRAAWTLSFGERKTPAGPGGPRLVRFDPSTDDAPPDLALPGEDDKRFRLTLYAQAFNIASRLNATAFNGVAGSPSFGQPTASTPGRRLEAGASLRF
jgi:hypothetical protein